MQQNTEFCGQLLDADMVTRTTLPVKLPDDHNQPRGYPRVSGQGLGPPREQRLRVRGFLPDYSFQRDAADLPDAIVNPIFLCSWFLRCLNIVGIIVSGCGLRNSFGVCTVLDAAMVARSTVHTGFKNLNRKTVKKAEIWWSDIGFLRCN